MRSRILTDQSFDSRLFKRGSAMGVYAPYHRVGKSFSVYLSADKPAVAFEMCIELFERSCRDLIKRKIADFRDDLIVDSLLIGGLCVRSESGLAVVLIPEVYPLSEWHFGRAPSDLGSSDCFFKCFELFEALCFCFCKHVLGFGQTAFIVSDDDSPFPSSVLSFSYCS